MISAAPSLRRKIRHMLVIDRKAPRLLRHSWRRSGPRCLRFSLAARCPRGSWSPLRILPECDCLLAACGLSSAIDCISSVKPFGILLDLVSRWFADGSRRLPPPSPAPSTRKFSRGLGCNSRALTVSSRLNPVGCSHRRRPRRCEPARRDAMPRARIAKPSSPRSIRHAHRIDRSCVGTRGD